VNFFLSSCFVFLRCDSFFFCIDLGSFESGAHLFGGDVIMFCFNKWNLSKTNKK
jgi:hypothetical protein